MKFELLHTIDLLHDLYEKPRSIERFNEYLTILQGNTKGDMAIPISGFNPMAKDVAADKLKELKELDAEGIMLSTANDINGQLEHKSKSVFKLVLNLCDDVQGSWTNRFTSDYDHKFKMSALLSRNFCVVVFWTSEKINTELIRTRTEEAIYRTTYRTKHPTPLTLQQHIDQERAVFQKMNSNNTSPIDPEIRNFYNKNRESEEYNLIFNFLYGDKACESLGFPTYGIEQDYAGFEFAKALNR